MNASCAQYAENCHHGGSLPYTGFLVLLIIALGVGCLLVGYGLRRTSR